MNELLCKGLLDLAKAYKLRIKLIDDVPARQFEIDNHCEEPYSVWTGVNWRRKELVVFVNHTFIIDPKYVLEPLWDLILGKKNASIPYWWLQLPMMWKTAVFLSKRWPRDLRSEFLAEASSMLLYSCPSWEMVDEPKLVRRTGYWKRAVDRCKKFGLLTESGELALKPVSSKTLKDINQAWEIALEHM